MQVILLRDIKNIGRKNDIKEVSDGYARNFLFPKNLAQPATTVNLANRQVLIAREGEELARLKQLAVKLQNEVLEFKIKTGAHGEVFGGISRDDIQKELVKKSYGGVTVELSKSIKKMGEIAVTVNLGKGIKATAKILIS